MMLLYSNGDICIETELNSKEKKSELRNYQSFRKTPEKVGIVYFREKDQSKFVGNVWKGSCIGKGIMIALDGSMYESEYKAGDFSRGYFLGRYGIPKINESLFNTTMINMDRKLNEKKKIFGNLKTEKYYDTSLELEYFRNKHLHDEEKFDNLLKDLLRNWELEDYFEVIHKRLTLEDLLLSSKLLTVNGIARALGVSKVGHRIKLSNCIKQFRLVFGPLLLPRQFTTHPTESETSNGSFLLPLFISRPLNLYSYSGINIPFEQLIFLQKLERTDFPCKCNKGGKFFFFLNIIRL